jgi:DNA-binding beta-propeller fold protein YncE
MLRASTAILVVVVLLISSHPPGAPLAGTSRPSSPPAGHVAAASTPVGPIGGRLFDVQTTLPDGDSNSVTGLAVDPGTGTVYAANELAGTVTAFNESTGAIEQSRTLATFAAGSFPAGLLLDALHHRVFVSVSTRFNIPSGAGWLLVLNESDLSTELNVSLAGSPFPPFEPTYLAYDDPTDQLFVENSTAGLLAVVDLGAGSVTKFLACPVADCAEHGYGLLDLPQFHTLVVPTCAQALWFVNVSNDSTRTLLSGPSGAALMAWVAFDTVDQVLWVENYSYFGAIGSFLGYNVSTLALLADVPGAPPRETGMGYDPLDNLLVTTNINGSHEIATYRGTDAGLVASSGINGSVSDPFLTLTVDPVTHRAIAGGPGNWSTVAYQLPTLAVDRVYPSFPLSQDAVTTDPAHGTFVVASASPNTLRAVSEQNASPRWQVALPATAAPVGVAVDGATDRVFVADASNGTLLAYDAGSGAYLATAMLGVPAGGVCALLSDPSLGLLFVGSTQPAEVLAFQVSTSQVIGTYPMGGQVPCRLSIDPSDQDLVILSTTATGSLFDVVPTAAGLFTPRSAATVGPSPVDLAIDRTGAVYLLANSGVEVDRFANTSAAAAARANLTGSPSSELALDPTDGLLFLGATHTGTIDILQASSLAPVGQFSLPGIVGPLTFDTLAEIFVAPTSATGQVLLATAVPVPSSPTALVATAGNTSISLGWAAPTSSGPDPLTGYQVVLARPGAGGTMLDLNGSSLSTEFSNLTNGIAYNVSVAGFSAAGVGTSVATATVTPAGVPFPPTNLSVSALGPTELTLNWSPPATDDGAPITQYVLHYAPFNGGPAAILGVGIELGAVLPGLDSGTNYSVYVTATNAVGDSHASAAVHATTTTIAPTGSALLLWVGGALAVIAIVAALGFVWFRRRRAGKNEATPSAGGASDPPTKDSPAPADLRPEEGGEAGPEPT